MMDREPVTGEAGEGGKIGLGSKFSCRFGVIPNNLDTLGGCIIFWTNKSAYSNVVDLHGGGVAVAERVTER